MTVQELIDQLNKVKDKGKFIFHYNCLRISEIEETRDEVFIY